MKKLPYKIMLDRYSQKELNKDSILINDIVVATVDETDPLYPQKEICEVTRIDQSGVLKLRNYFDADEEFVVHKDKVSLPMELSEHDIWRRMAKGNANNEHPDVSSIWEQKFLSILTDWKFVPGGRIMAMLGTANQDNLTAFNCFVLPSPDDSRGGAIDSLNKMIEIMARGGGVGINLSSLRPRNAIVKGVNGTSSGSVSWGGGYSYYTGLVEQGGSRRGALLEGLAVWHPDIEEFIDIKKKKGEMLNANLSVLLTEDFMYMVKMDLDWWLEFPDTTHENYDSEWDGNLLKWKNKGYPVIAYKRVRAKDLWNKIIESNWASAEPGVIWIERYNQLSNSWYFEEIVCTNPCGEQGLPPWGVCNLGHVNLAKIKIVDYRIDYDDLENTIRTAVRFLDNIIDITSYFFEENKDVQKKTRRIGLGTMGLAELLINLGIRYGSEESINFINDLYRRIRDMAYDASVDLAIEKGPFELFNLMYLEGEFIKHLPDVIKAKMAVHGIRNVALLTQAPTGSSGTMCDTSTGIEPFYDWKYFRRGRLGTEIQYVHVCEQYIKKLGADPETYIGTLPNYFVTAKELTPEEHVKVMATIQQYTDSSISKTVNCPEDWKVEQVNDLYMMAYDLGCKGLTIYRDKSRDSQVLESIGTLQTEEKSNTALPTKWGEILAKPKDTIHKEVKFTTGCGKIRLFIGYSPSLDNRVIDVYTVINSAGGCQLNIQGEVIAISKFLRAGGKIETLLEDSNETGACPSYQFQRGRGNKELFGKSCFNGIVRTIVEFQSTLGSTIVDEKQVINVAVFPEVKKLLVDIQNLPSVCPGCGESMIKETGCWCCKHCGYSKCE